MLLTKNLKLKLNTFFLYFIPSLRSKKRSKFNDERILQIKNFHLKAIQSKMFFLKGGVVRQIRIIIYFILTRAILRTSIYMNIYMNLEKIDSTHHINTLIWNTFYFKELEVSNSGYC